ncbi:hypothetical protein Mpsy_2630 [Methanolobus psychrophilus R15]|nr:hypothetical protein Mpsy_2630 [Methanolobus psychrophilus R15]
MEQGVSATEQPGMDKKCRIIFKQMGFLQIISQGEVLDEKKR